MLISLFAVENTKRHVLITEVDTEYVYAMCMVVAYRF